MAENMIAVILVIVLLGTCIWAVREHQMKTQRIYQTCYDHGYPNVEWANGIWYCQTNTSSVRVESLE